MQFFDSGTIPYLIIGIVLIVGIVGFLAMSYVKAPPNEAYIISGLSKKPRILVGSGGFRIPFIERIDKLFLGQMSVDVKTSQSVPTNDFINVKVDAVAKVMVGKTDEAIHLASQNFLNFTAEEIAKDLKDSLEGNMREIIGTLSLKNINTDRDSFSDQVLLKASGDMNKLGIEIISCNIQNVTDDNGLIKDLGADNTAKIKKDASISKAIADRDVAIEQAKADKEANDARVIADLEIAQRQNELQIKQAELKKLSDVKQAEADAAYAIKEQEQKKFINTAKIDAEIAEAERRAVLKEQEVGIKQKELDASVQKQADADKYAQEQNASAELVKRQREADARLYEKQKEAEARKAEADSQKYATEQEAEAIKSKGDAEAYATKVKGEAEASAIQAKGLAEAEAMEKKAMAYQKYNRVAMAQMAIEILPKVASEIAKPLSSIDKITMIGDGGMENISGHVPLIMAKTMEAMKEATGVDLKEIMRAETFEGKTTQNHNVHLSADEKTTQMVSNLAEKLTSDKKETKEKD